ncbi:hypothetical protein CR513_04000, partial [Mucuna pruriens]
MGLPTSSVEECSGTLFGFPGEWEQVHKPYWSPTQLSILGAFFNMIIWRPTLDRLRVVVSTLHLMEYPIGKETPIDMPEIDPNFLCHHLSITPRTRPVAQKRRRLGEEKGKADKEETNKLLVARFIRELQYPT